MATRTTAPARALAMSWMAPATARTTGRSAGVPSVTTWRRSRPKR
ncbi:TPA_asm: hypothetical protein PROPHIFSIL01-1_88 [Mycobacterium phage prophiFSIL01-1]|nr:TPA_asm: hypothetical protein PROPHIFSIL01-1_88 [Mycobacterium phage prophiFSIL01-1]